MLSVAFIGFGCSTEQSSFRRADCTELLQDCFKHRYEKVFLSEAPDDAESLRSVFDQITEPAPATERQIAEMHRAYIMSRLWDEAIAFRHSHKASKLESIPKFVKAPGFSELKPTFGLVRSEGEVEWRNLDFDSRSLIIIVTQPSCHFSENAFSSIEKDQDLKRALLATTVLVTPQDGRLNLNDLLAWNQMHSPFELNLMDRVSKWPGIRGRSTPEFYFFKRGKLVFQFDGWPKQGNTELLHKGLQKIKE